MFAGFDCVDCFGLVLVVIIACVGLLTLSEGRFDYWVLLYAVVRFVYICVFRWFSSALSLGVGVIVCFDDCFWVFDYCVECLLWLC